MNNVILSSVGRGGEVYINVFLFGIFLNSVDRPVLCEKCEKQRESSRLAHLSRPW